LKEIKIIIVQTVEKIAYGKIKLKKERKRNLKERVREIVKDTLREKRLR